MREYAQVAGVRRWHGSEFVDIQAQTLDHLQKFFEQFGNCIISGCAITVASSIATLQEGYIGCAHADGYKIVKVTQTTLGNISTLPKYLSISKTAENKLYNNSSNLLSANLYSFTIGTSVPSGGYITLNTTGMVKWKDLLVSGDTLRYIGDSGQPAFQNAFDSNTCADIPSNEYKIRFYKNVSVVTLEGSFRIVAISNYANLSAASDKLLFTLPSGYRTDKIKYLSNVVHTQDGDATVWLKIYTNGDVKLHQFTDVQSGVTAASFATDDYTFEMGLMFRGT